MLWDGFWMLELPKKSDSDGIRTHASKETGDFNLGCLRPKTSALDLSATLP